MQTQRSRAQESTDAIEKIYTTMRHLFNRGFYKPMGVSGESLRESLLLLRPEIYGSIAQRQTELNGLLYVLDRLPIGIEQCRFINMMRGIVSLILTLLSLPSVVEIAIVSTMNR